MLRAAWLPRYVPTIWSSHGVHLHRFLLTWISSWASVLFSLFFLLYGFWLCSRSSLRWSAFVTSTTIPTLPLPPQLTLDLNSHPVRLVCARVVLNRNHFLKPHEITPSTLILTPDASLTPSVSALHTPSSAFLTPPLALQAPSRSYCQHTNLPRLEFKLNVLQSLF